MKFCQSSIVKKISQASHCKHQLVQVSGLSVVAGRNFCTRASRPKHWDEDKDREPTKSVPDPESDVSSWIRRVLSVQIERSPEEKRIQAFWEYQRQKHIDQDQVPARWSHKSMLRAAIQRPVPLKNITWYTLYTSSLTASASYFSTHWNDYASPLVEYLMSYPHYLDGYAGFCATALFLTLNFRLSRTADRWWTARMHWGNLIAHVRSLAQTAQLSISNKPIACEIGLLSFAFIRALEFHLRREKDAKYVEAFSPLLAPEELDDLLAHPHRPYYFSERLTARLSDAYDAGHIKNVRLLVAMNAKLEEFALEMQALDRIANTPEPWSYQKLMRLNTQLWLGMLPLAIMPSLYLATPVFCASIGFVVYKLDDIAVEIKQPFGCDKSDIALCLLNDRLQRELLVAMLAYANREPKTWALVRPA